MYENILLPFQADNFFCYKFESVKEEKISFVYLPSDNTKLYNTNIICNETRTYRPYSDIATHTEYRRY